MIKLAFERPGPSNHIGQIICKVTKQEFCHVEIWLSGEQSQARCFSAREGSNVSFMTRDLSGWEIRPLFLTSDEEATLTGFCLGAQGKLYNYPGIVDFEFKLSLNHPWMLFCSQTASLALTLCAPKRYQFPKPCDKISPGDLASFLGYQPEVPASSNMSEISLRLGDSLEMKDAIR